MSIWEAITGRYKDLPEVTAAEIETLRSVRFIQFKNKIDNKIALDLMRKDLVRLSRGGYALTGRGYSVLAAKG
jgi:hypothetical protein